MSKMFDGRGSDPFSLNSQDTIIDIQRKELVREVTAETRTHFSERTMATNESQIVAETFQTHSCLETDTIRSHGLQSGGKQTELTLILCENTIAGSIL